MNKGIKFFIGTVVLLSVLTFLISSPNSVDTGKSGDALVLYCAAGIKPAVLPIAKEYERIFGKEVQLMYGGSGTLLSNLEVSRSGDLYIAGDNSYVVKAQDKGHVQESLALAYMTPIIAVQKGNPKGIKSVADLLRADIRVAVGNPEQAAIGKVTKKALTKSGQWSAFKNNVQDNGVFKPTVPELAIDVKIGAVDAAIIWDATAKQNKELEIIYDPALETMQKKITIGVLTYSEQPTEALKFMRYLGARDKGLVSFYKNGYKVVKGDLWAVKPELVLFSGGVNRLALKDTVAEFEQREGVTVVTTYNGCGILVGQMKMGLMPDGYMACDSSYMQQVLQHFDSPHTISETDMVLLVKGGNPKGIKTLKDLTQPGIKVAVANAKYSALGGLTDQLFTGAGLYDAIRKNVTYGDAPTADMLTSRIATGREDVAIVYRANTIKLSDEYEVLTIDHITAKAEQPIATYNNSNYKYTMDRLIKAIESEKSKKRFTKSGFNWML